MPAYRDRRSGSWRYRKLVRMPDGSRPRIEGTPSLNTKLAAEQAERAHIERLLRGEPERDAWTRSRVKTSKAPEGETLGCEEVSEAVSEADQ